MKHRRRENARTRLLNPRYNCNRSIRDAYLWNEISKEARSWCAERDYFSNNLDPLLFFFFYFYLLLTCNEGTLNHYNGQRISKLDRELMNYDGELYIPNLAALTFEDFLSLAYFSFEEHSSERKGRLR